MSEQLEPMDYTEDWQSMIAACEYQIDYWLDEEDLAAVEAYVEIRKFYRELLKIKQE